MAGNSAITQRGDQTLVGDAVLVDILVLTGGFKLYVSQANPAYPDHSTEATIWVALDSEYETKEAALIAAVNIANGG